MNVRIRTLRVPGLVPGAELELDVLADDAVIGPPLARGAWV
jgi:hypothetical protein